MKYLRNYLICVVAISLLFFNCGGDDNPTKPDQSDNEKGLTTYISAGIPQTMSTLEEGVSYSQGFSPHLSPEIGALYKGKKDADEPESHYDSTSGWWYTVRDSADNDSDTPLFYTFAESLQYRDSADSFCRESDSAYSFNLRLHYFVQFDSMQLRYSSQMDYENIHVDTGEVDTVTLNGDGDWSMSILGETNDFTTSYNNIKWVWQSDSFANYPVGGSIIYDFNDGASVTTIEFDGDETADLMVESGDTTEYYVINLDSGTITERGS